MCNTRKEKQIVASLFGLVGAAVIVTVVGSILLARRGRAATLLDFLGKANPKKRKTNIKGFVEVTLVVMFVLDIATDFSYGLQNRHSRSRALRILSYVIIVNTATQFLHGNVLLFQRFRAKGWYVMAAVFLIPVIPAAGFDLVILLFHALEPSAGLGFFNVEQYWSSRKVFEVLYESLPQLVLKSIIFVNTPVSSRRTLTHFVLSFITSALR